MGNYKFRFADMIPNAWFYKLTTSTTTSSKKTRNQNTNSTKKKSPLPLPITTSSLYSSSLSSTSSSIASAPPPLLPPTNSDSHHPQPHDRQRKSYYFSRDLTSTPPDTFHNNLAPEPTRLPDQPRKSTKKRRPTRRMTHRKLSPSSTTCRVVTAGCSCRSNMESVWANKPDSTPDTYPNSSSSSENESLLPELGSDRGSFDSLVSSLSSNCPCKHKNDKFDGKKFENPNLPPIITKPAEKKEKNEKTQIRRSLTKIEERNECGSLSVEVMKEDIMGISSKEQRTRRFPVNSPGVKLRTNSPRIQAIAGRKISSRRNLSESFAVVKLSEDPQRDFKESMVEMIMENNIRASKDLEELLACYLSLNADEYHELIINVFKQIWFDITDIRFK